MTGTCPRAKLLDDICETPTLQMLDCHNICPLEGGITSKVSSFKYDKLVHRWNSRSLQFDSMLTGMRDVFKECKPDVVLVHGDTTTSTAAALAAFYQQIPVGHVEAGLRTHNIYNVRKPIHEVFGEDLTRPNFFFIEPLQYLEFVYLMEKSTVVLTDSGGIQEEAPGLGKPVLVMRDTTERPEALESGTVHLVGTNHDLIVSEVSTLLEDAAAYERMSKAVNPYGDGKACERIVRVLKGEEVDRYEV